ncbi:hypothetical protein M406DRAFT_331113 [Cryphonectria parasitica EP155]|uniref:Rhodopsin domain-containing protein n=1 Tax=Cryphonectria parasitica (strain ATCC 38755 / EP155) TaxID=660469 RepID=A0A9P5CPA6_CRYP1|nr:uncharacterized protein M406DRAFT_331113 [Cryphonectria parasitica EP155]KAF3764795.1 hypothetical protein M406DRAFT_331113 [Cryphonectria parasitica EP155]
MSQVGVIPPPAGETAHFNDGFSDLQVALIVVNSVTYFFATVFMFLRFYTSAFINKRTEPGDFFVFASWAIGAASFGETMSAIQYGYGQHLWDVTAEQITGYYGKLITMSVTYFWSPSLTKLALLTLFYSVNRSKWGRICTWLLAISIFVYTTVFTVLIAGPCNPLVPANINCVNNVGAAHAALNILSDLIVIVLPVPLIHGLQMPIKQKITVGVLMTLGSFCVVASIVRIVYVTAIQNDVDTTYAEARVGVWSSVEVNIGIMCVSMARLKPFMQRYFPNFLSLGSSHGNSNYKGASSYGPNTSGRRPTYNAYELHSVQPSSVVPPEMMAPEMEGKIRIKTEYYVSRSTQDQDAKSTDAIWKEPSHGEWH